MILHLVTDRRRLSQKDGVVPAIDCVVRQARFAAEAGIDVVQVREHDLDGHDLAALVTAVIATTRGSRTRVVVNDRLDVALACGAAGLHLRGDSVTAAQVRRHLPPGFLIGRSVHSASDVTVAGPVDYLIAGTVWPTPSKPAGHELIGVAGLADIVVASQVPVLAIGGVDALTVADIARAGAAGGAGIGVFIDPRGAPCRAMPLAGVAERLRIAFDMARSRS